MAFRLFYRILNQPLNATPEQIDRQRAIVGPAKLSDEDLNQLFLVMADYGEKLNAFRHDLVLARSASPDMSEETVQRLTLQQDNLVSNATQDLTPKLSAEGMARLRNLVMFERRNMKIFLTPDMSDEPGVKK